MYALETNPTLAQIIERSATCHPSLLIEALDGMAKEDRTFAETSNPSPRTKQAISFHAEQCDLAKRAIEMFDAGDKEAVRLIGLGAQIIAAGFAAKLQCLPRHILTEAASRA